MEEREGERVSKIMQTLSLPLCVGIGIPRSDPQRVKTLIEEGRAKQGLETRDAAVKRSHCGWVRAGEQRNTLRKE